MTLIFNSYYLTNVLFVIQKLINYLKNNSNIRVITPAFPTYKIRVTTYLLASYKTFTLYTIKVSNLSWSNRKSFKE